MSTATPIHAPAEHADSAMPARPSLRLALRLDPLLTLAVLGLGVCSLVTIAGATRDDVPGHPAFYVERQGVYLVAGLVLMLALSRIDYSRLRELKFGIYGLMIAGIFLVLGVGAAARGSRRWIELPFFRLQPSEIGKILLIVALAAFIVDRARHLKDRETTARVLLIGLFPAIVVMAQPDLGTALVYVVVTGALLFVAGTPLRHFAALGALGLAAILIVTIALPAAGVQVLKPYQTDRLTAFMHPSDDAGAEGYQQQQSKIAIGSGRKTGRGTQDATQTKLNFLPENRTDFIFAVVGETFGFAGGALVLSLYALLIWRGLRILTLAKNLFGALIAGGIVAMLLFQVFVNVGMTVGIMPITGVPAPLLSYGGSSMLVTFMAIGLLQSIGAQARATAAGKTRARIL